MRCSCRAKPSAERAPTTTRRTAMPRTGRESAALRTALIPTWWLRALTPAGDGSPTRTSEPSDSRKSPFLVPTGKSAAVGEDGDGCRRCRSKEPEVRDGKARRETTEVPGREPVRRHGDD